MRLIVEALSVELGGRKVLDGIGLDLAPGQVIGLLGPNGAGKSTLMRALAGQVEAHGSMHLGANDLAALAPGLRARLLAYLPQTRTIGWRLTARDLVTLGRLPWRGFGRRLSAEDRAAIDRAMEMMDILPLADRIATELSGGEQARVLTARAVAQTTPLLIADEPASGLDPAHQITMMQALKRIAAEGATVLVSLHDLTLAARWCDQVVMLKNGRLFAAGEPAHIMSDDRLAEVYGVTAHRATDGKGLILTPVDLVENRQKP